MSEDHYSERPSDETAAIGWAIYHKALGDGPTPERAATGSSEGGK